MKIVIAVDSFKGSLSSLEAGNDVKRGALEAIPDAQVVVLPLADGGEGTVDALIAGMAGREVFVEVTGPHGRAVTAKYGIIDQSGMAVMEMSQAAGLPMVTGAERDPLSTTTRGVGEMMLDALDKGCRSFIIGIGGSATNDGGVGMLTALGCAFLDADGKAVEGCGRDVERIVTADLAGLDPRIKECDIRVACDVNNPLCGERGASAVFGPQKGATPETVIRLDKALSAFAQIVKKTTGIDNAEVPGSGAAGGLGYAFMTFLGGKLRPGADIVLDVIGLEESARGADFVVTGEGRLDFQTSMGKAPIGVAKIGKKVGAVVLAFCGCASDDAAECNEHGIDAFFPITRGPVTLEEAMERNNASENLRACASQVFRLISLLRHGKGREEHIQGE